MTRAVMLILRFHLATTYVQKPIHQPVIAERINEPLLALEILRSIPRTDGGHERPMWISMPPGQNYPTRLLKSWGQQGCYIIGISPYGSRPFAWPQFRGRPWTLRRVNVGKHADLLYQLLRYVACAKGMTLVITSRGTVQRISQGP